MASNPLREPIRPTQRDDGSVSKFHGLACFEELREQVIKGIPIPEVARWLQVDKGVFTTDTRENVVRALYRFKSRIPPSEKEVITPVAAQAAIERTLTKAAVGLDEVQELERLYHLQMERIRIDVGKEIENKKLNGSTANDIRLAMDMLSKSAAIKIDLGVGGKKSDGVDASKSMSALQARHAGSPVQAVLGNPEARRRVLHTANTIIAFIGGDGDRAALLQSLLQSTDKAEEPIPAESVIDAATIPEQEPDALDEVGSDVPEEGAGEDSP
jgi:hypothetical protein